MNVIDKEEQAENEYNDAKMRVDPWFDKISNEGFVGQINPDDLLTIFRFKGAKEITEEQKVELSKLKLTEVRKGLEAVWGNHKLDQFEVLMSQFSLDYNSTEGNRRLPMALSSFSGETGLGNRRLFLELTQVAYGTLDLKSFKERTEAALKNGKLWQERKDEERISLSDPDNFNKIKKVNQIAPGFVDKLYDWIRDPIK